MSSFEIELKFGLQSPASGQEILNSPFIQNMCISDSKKEMAMRAVYYDNEAKQLTSNKIGYRIRKEADKYIATVKYSAKAASSQPFSDSAAKKDKDQSHGKGFSKRSEYNIEVSGETPDPSVFISVIPDKEVVSLLSSIKPLPMFITDFTRTLLLVHYRTSIIEVSFDFGEIIANTGSFQSPLQGKAPDSKSPVASDINAPAIQPEQIDCGFASSVSHNVKTEPICELECELKSGCEEDLISLGQMLEKEFKIAPLNLSKLKRGLNLIK